MTTQSAQILSYLKTGKALTALEALQMFGCLRLAARVKELRDRGARIGSHRRVIVRPDGTTKHVAAYWIPGR